MYCNEVEFKNSAYGKAKIQKITSSLSTTLRPITSVHFTSTFLKTYYQEMTPVVNQTVFNCYESLLDFWTHDRYGAIVNEYNLGQANQAYETWVKNNDKSPFDFLNSIPLVLGLVAVIVVFNSIRK